MLACLSKLLTVWFFACQYLQNNTMVLALVEFQNCCCLQAGESVLERQNRLLTGQLEVNKQNLSSIEAELQETRNNQANFDNVLSTVNRTWKELIDDLELLLLRANGTTNGSRVFDLKTHLEKGAIMVHETFGSMYPRLPAKCLSRQQVCRNGKTMLLGLIIAA